MKCLNERIKTNWLIYENGSTDNCDVATITLSQYNFNCSEVGNNPITMTVTDINGNINTCAANVIVIDTTIASM